MLSVLLLGMRIMSGGLRIRIGTAVMLSLFMTACADPAYRPATKPSYRYPSPTLDRVEESEIWWGRLKNEVRRLREGLSFQDSDGPGWVYSRYRDKPTDTVYQIAHIEGDQGALKVQCAVGGKDDQSLDLFIHHPVLCGDGSVEGQVWENHWQDVRVQTHQEELKSDRKVQYDGSYVSFDNRGRATGGECQTYWIGGAQKQRSHLGNWLMALLLTDGRGYFRTVAHTETDLKPQIRHHEKNETVFALFGTSHDLEYDYDIEIDLRHGKHNFAKVLEACGY
jgi:hypothetical protein